MTKLSQSFKYGIPLLPNHHHHQSPHYLQPFKSYIGQLARSIKLLNNPKEIANIDINRIIQWSNYIHEGALIQAEFAEEITQKLTAIEARGRPQSTPRTKRQLARIHDIRPSQYVGPDTFSLARDGINRADPRCNFVERSPSISFCASSSRARRWHLN